MIEFTWHFVVRFYKKISFSLFFYNFPILIEFDSYKIQNSYVVYRRWLFQFILQTFVFTFFIIIIITTTYSIPSDYGWYMLIAIFKTISSSSSITDLTILFQPVPCELVVIPILVIFDKKSKQYYEDSLKKYKQK